MEDDDIKNAAEVREWLTKLIIEKQDEIERIKTTLSLIDTLLKQGSFRTAANLNTNSSKKVSPFQQRKGSDDSSISTIRTARADFSRTTGNDNSMTTSSSFSSSSSQSPSSSSRTTIPQSQTQSQSSNRNDQYHQRASEREESGSTADNSQADEGREQVYEREEFEETRQLKRMKDGLVLATVKVSKNKIEIVPENTLTLYVDTPPFKSFFLNRILEGMKNKDLEKVRQGQLNENQILSYDTITTAATSDNNDNKKLIKKVQILNYREKERITEIFNTSAWVFTRMLEKSESFSKSNRLR